MSMKRTATALGLMLAAAATAGAQGSTAVKAGGTPVAPRTVDLVAQGASVVRAGLTSARQVQRMMDEARKASDIIRVTCLDDKLAQINANLRTAEARLAALKSAVDPARRKHESIVLTVVSQKLQVLHREAQQCVGQQMYETGMTKVVTEINADLLPFETDPSNPPIVLPPLLPTIPEPASPRR